MDTIAASGAESEELKVEDTPIEAYLRNWKWDMARYQHQGKKLTDLTSQILSMAGQMDEELKKLTTTHAEKTQALAALDRKKNVNISTSDFEDFLAPEVVSRLDVLDNEHLQTLFVAMPKAVEAEFLRDYVKIGASMDFMFKDEKLCVVAPDSAKLVMAQGEQVLYTITAIKGHYEAGYFDSDHVPDVEVQLQTGQCRDRRASSGAYVPGKMIDFIEPLKLKFREKRMIVRSFKYDESKTGGVEGLLEKARRDVADSQVNVIRWCKVTFGMLFPGLIHLKVITCFAESVLRYGVPINFLAVFLDPNLKKEKELKAALLNTITHLRPELKLGKLDKDEEGTHTRTRVSFNITGLYLT